MAVTKVLKAWRSLYEPAEPLEAAFKKMSEQTDIELRVRVQGSSVQAVAEQPSGLLVESSWHPDSPESRVRAVEEVLAVTYRRDRWR